MFVILLPADMRRELPDKLTTESGLWSSACWLINRFCYKTTHRDCDTVILACSGL